MTSNEQASAPLKAKVAAITQLRTNESELLAAINHVSALLGDQTYLLGQQPSSFDTTVYAFLWQILNAPYNSALKDSASSHGNLVDYIKRIEQKFFSQDPMFL